MNNFLGKFCMALLLSMPALCMAIDNPDAPDYVAEFQQRAHVYEDAIQKRAKTTQDYSKAYADYEKFLDVEMNNAYKALTAKLRPEQVEQIKQSQRGWIKYRDSEFAFISGNWTAATFGSSATLSRGGYRTSVINSRVVQLLNYLKNYPSG